MNSILLNTSTRYLVPLLVVLSLILLYRGHNLPGGGFIGGLVAASSVILLAYSRGWLDVEKGLPFDPITLMSCGLIIAMLSGLPGLLFGNAFMEGMWLPSFNLAFIGKVKLGTPLLFDVGVYFAVIGFTVKCALALGTHNDLWKS